MAVEARHNMNLFPSHQFITNRDFMKINQENANNNMYSCPQPSSADPSTIPECFLPLYQSPFCEAKNSMNKADSGLTYNINPATRKRQRDSSIQELNAFNYAIPQKTKLYGGSPLLDKDIVFQIHQYQSEIDRFVSQHTEKVGLELEQQRTGQARMLVSAIQGGIVKKLKERDDEIQRMGKLNWVLQERVKTLCVENQLWKDLAQSNEATAKSLRSNLEQVLLGQVSEDRQTAGAPLDVAVADDAESSCGSSDFGRENDAVADADTVKFPPLRTEDSGSDVANSGGGGNGSRRKCRSCGVRESKVLLLPCRHLCLCTACASTLRICPVCTSVMTASVHVNFS